MGMNWQYGVIDKKFWVLGSEWVRVDSEPRTQNQNLSPPMLPRSVIFIDPPSFCTTVEGLVAPALRSRPLAVAAPGADRATVLALSPEARRAGITRGMPVRRARKLCPDLVLLPPNPRLYARASRALHEIFQQYAPIIEPRWYGHAFLDLTGTGRLFGPALDVAARIQREARERVRLPVSVGVATNKLVSQACGVLINQDAEGLASPLEVPPGEEAPFLAPHPVEVLPELDPKTRERLDDYQLERVGEVAAIEARQLCTVFGAAGSTLYAQSHGIDPRPVLPPERKAEFRAAHTLATDTNDLAVLHALLRRLVEQLGHRLRTRRLAARRLTVTLAYVDYAAARRRVPLAAGTLDVELWDAARRAFTLAHRRTLAIRAVGVMVDQLAEADEQLELWSDRTEKLHLPGDHSVLSPQSPVLTCPQSAVLLQRSVDRIRARWGWRAVRGRTAGNGERQ